MSKPMERWFSLPELYMTLDKPETLKRFAAAYMQRWYPEWKPVIIRNFRVLATKEEGTEWAGTTK